MIETFGWRDLPFLAGNRIFLDYIENHPRALSFYAHGPLAYAAAMDVRRSHPYPRQAAAELLAAYNRRLGASPQTMAQIEALRQPDSYVVVGGQQAGLLGGPVYAAYKILSTIRLARTLSDSLGVLVAPVYWMASEDHDFGEINHVQFMRPDGEIGRVGFEWPDKGRPIADLPMTAQVREALDAYWQANSTGPFASVARQLFEPDSERYCDWQASFWLRLFAQEGLILVEPHVLRPLAGELFRSLIEGHGAIQERIRTAAEALERAGYTPLLSPDSAGVMYTLDVQGRRVRVEVSNEAARDAARYPERYSTDAALRPLFADATLPVLASTLGAGETAYQGMLLPLYELFGVPQPLLYPRKSYTIVSSSQQKRLEAYGLTAYQVLAHELQWDTVLRSRMPAADLERFNAARSQARAALAPLEPYLQELDPNLGRTWEQALNTTLRHIDKLEERATNAALSRAGLSRQELQAMRNVLLPRGRMQERELPLSHFVQRYGPAFLPALREAGDLDVFGHDVVTLEDDHA